MDAGPSVAGTTGTILIGKTNASAIDIGNAVTNPATRLLGTGQKTINGNLDATSGVDVSGAALTVTAQRMLGAMGAAVASANDLALGLDGNAFSITGAVQVNRVGSASWQAGATVVLHFAGAPLVKHNQAAGGGFVEIMLAQSADFQAAADDRLSLYFDGAKFWETARTRA